MVVNGCPHFILARVDKFMIRCPSGLHAASVRRAIVVGYVSDYLTSSRRLRMYYILPRL